VLAGEIIAVVPLAQFLAFALPLSRIDIRLHRLPNVFTLPALLSAQSAVLIASWVDGSWARYAWATATLLVVGGLALAASIAGALGMGDVKLIAATSPALAWFSPAAALAALALALVLAAAWAVVALLIRRLTLGGRIAMGPFLLAGVVAGSVLALGDVGGIDYLSAAVNPTLQAT
jgi:leader peptidase (prepilin peptidase) / N-methyltransferase